LADLFGGTDLYNAILNPQVTVKGSNVPAVVKTLKLENVSITAGATIGFTPTGVGTSGAAGWQNDQIVRLTMTCFVPSPKNLTLEICNQDVVGGMYYGPVQQIVTGSNQMFGGEVRPYRSSFVPRIKNNESSDVTISGLQITGWRS
jgi:hypothetical protein